ncbi:MAG: universal stress protein, partial [Gammaproteobacteria bacterium]|nr:universal stress protein [Gammaproteobacteria bacterium]
MKILLGIDGSRYALAATRFVCGFLAQPGRQVDMLHVLPLIVREGAAAPRREPEGLHVPPRPRSWLDRAERRLHSRGFRVAKRVRRGAPARVLPELAAKGGYDLIVLGAKGRADNPYLPTGSVALAMLEHHVPADIVLVRERELKREKEVTTRASPFPVLFATDGSARIVQVAETFHRLFQIPELRPIAVAVAELPDPAVLAALESDDRRRLLSRVQATARAWAREAKPVLARPGLRPEARVVQGRPAAAIID